jgi:hypothetical protein
MLKEEETLFVILFISLHLNLHLWFIQHLGPGATHPEEIMSS